MALAIFDLDNTLIGGDSDHLWGEFLCDQQLVDADAFAERNDQFYEDYKAGQLDIHAYLRFALDPLKGQPREVLDNWHREFMTAKIEPIMLPKAHELIQQHRDRGDTLLIITATNEFITRPIANFLGVDELLASEAEQIDGVYTGEPAGIPSYKEGKITRLQQWLAGRDLSLAGACFYSDSHNDLPLLELVDHPVAVDPDETLLARAKEAGWPVISLRQAT
ncbi:HAD family hydrolase [Pseudohalioglobus sediminis]|uniref:Histidinol-phosphatase n=1 Tax=Pseudohalioglobus sediminis TaxID=2606449 RepID=A0A5B0WTB4_9GAMM|nr:HAD family hydrolase [Pseudohalioglobus sediminis]KAA1189718.1 HAD family hydrolase [Pseudohalioglobus sediminis]